MSECIEENWVCNLVFYGMMLVLISYEGYLVKLMYLYWDNFWVLCGYKDVVIIVMVLGKVEVL